MTTNPQDLDALVKRADIMAGMLRMGERIAYGTDVDMICALSDAITTLRRDLLAAEAAGRVEYARGLRDAAALLRGQGYMFIPNLILAMIPEGE